MPRRPKDDQQLIRDVLDSHHGQCTGTRPRGWLGSGLQETWKTLEYLAEAGLDYVLRLDQRRSAVLYGMPVADKKIVSLPYSTEINDLPQFRAGRSNAEFEQMIRSQFDTLYEEGAESARVMAICLHPFRHWGFAPHRRPQIRPGLYSGTRRCLVRHRRRNHRCLAGLRRDVLESARGRDDRRAPQRRRY